jgi:hypothetical protein
MAREVDIADVLDGEDAGDGERSVTYSVFVARDLVLYMRVAIIRSEATPGAGWQFACDRVWLSPLSTIFGGE